ncbi:MAG TPA: redoxin domain-containing protein [Saprospiraceae bacterium]|nr:redoxin domain-containing protein [Saprospiraceae bacterium]MCB9328174.1 redoxin domain-containing protein [Lewinellaceae bacterium]HPK09324.1 redoxin domain-containing protein [Saprospiraceae bacterium]HPQ20606.1 redoxin domain-containing protein [Saprospiraceae bacterium]HRX29379.1 redoxin domain-containing protein [Saprospiraceae bacterium]
MKFFVSAICLLFSISAIGQAYPDFTITDTQGNVHNLYSDYLDQNKVVVIELFFVDCPPCNAIAPAYQAKYVQWGEGNGDVEFIELSTQAWDSNADVAGFKAQYGITAPGAGNDGGSKDAVLPILSGNYGPYYGTPSMAVIAPDGSVDYPHYVNDDLDVAIEAALQKQNTSSTTTVNSNVTLHANGSTPTDAFRLFLKPSGSDTPKIDITDALNSGNFSYPPSGFESVLDPVIILESYSSAPHPSVTAADLIQIQKHILHIIPFTDEAKIIASDANGNGSVTAADLILIRKSILQLINEYPNNVAGYFIYPIEIPIIPNPGGETSVDINIYRRGNVNF